MKKNELVAEITITLDRATIERIERVAREWGIPPGMIVSEHLAAWAETGLEEEVDTVYSDGPGLFSVGDYTWTHS